MKFGILLLLVGFFAVALGGWTETHNGRPTCTHPDEVRLVYWRNNFDSTAYFECPTTGLGPAIWRRCISESQFQPRLRRCVPYYDWEWEPNEDPPTLAEI